MRPAGIFLALALIIPQPARALSSSKFRIDSVKYVRVYDGDTFFVNIPGLPPVFGKEIPVRIAHIDAPELDGKSACEKRMAIEAGLEVDRVLSKAKRITLVLPRRDKYFRILADVLLDEHLLLSEYLLKKDLAYPYEGGTKMSIDWCAYPRKRI